MLRARIISAAVAAAVIVPCLIWGGAPGVAFLVAAFSLVGVWELTRHLKGLSNGLATGLTLALDLVVVASFYALPMHSVGSVAVLLPLLVLVIHLFLYNVIEQTVESATQMAFVLAYVSIPLGHAVLLSRLDAGVAWVFFGLVVVSLGDAGAYFMGNYCGKHRFSSRVSPKKTLEGLVGGLLGNLLGMVILAVAAPGLPSPGFLFKATLLLAVVAPLGDLAASAIKRRLGIKDFGVIMPGHGGILDRADALITAFPTLYYAIVLSGV